MAMEVQGIIDGTTVLLEARQKALKDTIKSKKASLRRACAAQLCRVVAPCRGFATALAVDATNSGLPRSGHHQQAVCPGNCQGHDRMTAQANEVAKRKRALSPKKQAALLSRIYHLPLQIARLEKKLEEVKVRLAAKAPGICFGSRKLFRAQFHLKESGFSSFEEWKAAWRKARSHQFFFVGSKGETGGNQTCTVSVIGPGTRKGKVRFSARIRLPDSMVGGEGKYVHVAFELGYGAAQVCASLVQGIALNYRFHREESGSWLVLISTDVKEAPKISREVGYGVLGVDFNADHLAVAEMNRDGNFLKSWAEDLELEGKTSEQREEVMSLALKRIVEYAVEHKLPISIEALDFSAKKADRRRRSKKQKVMLSSLMYSKYMQLMRTKCARAGVELIEVNPAFTSVIGRAKYTKSLGLSVHHAAALVIARRAMGCRERVPTVASVLTGPIVSEFALPGRESVRATGGNRANKLDSRWSALAVDLRKTLCLCPVEGLPLPWQWTPPNCYP